MSASMPDAALSARERLARSRERMSHWLADERDDGGEEQAASDSNRPRGARGWLKSLRVNPLAAIAIDAFTDWWARHPLQSSARLAEAAARETIAPLVKRHPVAVSITGQIGCRCRPGRTKSGENTKRDWDASLRRAKSGPVGRLQQTRQKFHRRGQQDIRIETIRTNLNGRSTVTCRRSGGSGHPTATASAGRSRCGRSSRPPSRSRRTAGHTRSSGSGA